MRLDRAFPVIAPGARRGQPCGGRDTQVNHPIHVNKGPRWPPRAPENGGSPCRNRPSPPATAPPSASPAAAARSRPGSSAADRECRHGRLALDRSGPMRLLARGRRCRAPAARAQRPVEATAEPARRRVDECASSRSRLVLAGVCARVPPRPLARESARRRPEPLLEAGRHRPNPNGKPCGAYVVEVGVVPVDTRCGGVIGIATAGQMPTREMSIEAGGLQAESMPTLRPRNPLGPTPPSRSGAELDAIGGLVGFYGSRFG